MQLTRARKSRLTATSENLEQALLHGFLSVISDGQQQNHLFQWSFDLRCRSTEQSPKDGILYVFGWIILNDHVSYSRSAEWSLICVIVSRIIILITLFLCSLSGRFLLNQMKNQGTREDKSCFRLPKFVLFDLHTWRMLSKSFRSHSFPAGLVPVSNRNLLCTFLWLPFHSCSW